jgi:hypothetical protein
VTSASIGVVHSRLSYHLRMVVRFIDCFLKEAIINKVRKTLNFFKTYFGAFFFFNLIFNFYLYIYFLGGIGEMAGQRFSRMNLCKTDLVIDQLKRKGQPYGRRSLI